MGSCVGTCHRWQTNFKGYCEFFADTLLFQKLARGWLSASRAECCSRNEAVRVTSHERNKL